VPWLTAPWRFESSLYSPKDPVMQISAVFRGFALYSLAVLFAKMSGMDGETFIEKIKVDKWYGIVLYIGILAAGTSMIKGDDFLSRKHLLGLGVGCILTGLSFFMAQKKEDFPYQEGILFRDITKHNWITIPVLLLGIFFLVFFGIKIFKDLL
jgi:hypothetical protein